ncbi:MAG: two-component system sensor histidine kinase NtrB [Thermodesulfobacteriota bacterium]
MPGNGNTRFEEFTENISDWIWEVDCSGRYTYSNRKVQDVLGYLPEEMLGKTPFDFMTGEESARVKPVFLDMLASQAPFFRWIHICLHREGRMVELETSGVPYFDTTGKLLGYRGVDRDITHCSRAELRRQKTGRMESLATLAGGIAHEFNNVLHILSGHIELIEDELADNEKTRLFRQTSWQSIRRLSDLVRQLLAFARCGKYHARVLELNDLIRRVLPGIKELFRNPAVRVSTALPDLSMRINADEAQISMAMSAILKNAMEATPVSGSIRIRTGIQEVDSVSAGHYPGLQPGKYVWLTVEDDGGGMDEETRRRVFEPFFTTKFQGRGLGMAAVYGIIKNHDGYIYVDSAPGQGTSIRIFLPAV